MKRALLLLWCLLEGCVRSLPRPESSGEWQDRFRACRAGDQGACYWRGISDLSEGRTEEGLKRVAAACEAGVGIACNTQGFYFSEGQHGMKVDPVRARTLWARSCSLGSKDGCDSWGTGLRDGVGGASDFPGAVAAYERACKLEDGAGCTNLARALLRGEGAPKDPSRAVTLLRTVCAREDDLQHSCRVLGAALVQGEGIAANIPEGLTLLRRACNLGDAEDCQEAGTLMAAFGTMSEAVRYLRTSCRWGRASGCGTLGLRLLEGPDDEGAHDEAREVLRKACQGGDQPSCEHVEEK